MEQPQQNQKQDIFDKFIPLADRKAAHRRFLRQYHRVVPTLYWVGILALFALVLSVAFIAPGTKEESKAGNQPTQNANAAPSTSQPATQRVDGIPDPCGLKDVDCPGEKQAVKRVIKGRVTSYQADPKQTDSDPCHTADGTDICDPVIGIPPYGIVANNCLAFGTEVEIRGERYFVHDRMNKRYGCEVFDVLTAGENITTPKGTTEPINVL